MAKLHAETDNIVGVKESTDSLKKLQDDLKLLPKDFGIFAGYERYLLVTVPFGSRGCTSFLCANSFPEVITELYDSLLRRDWQRAMQLQGILYDIYWLFDGLSSVVQVAGEEALRFRGFDVNLLPRWPMRAVPEEERARIRTEVKAISEKIGTFVTLKSS